MLQLDTNTILTGNLYLFLATQLFKILEKYRPETAAAKKQRLKARAESKVAKKEDTPTKKPNCLSQGVSTVVRQVEQKKAQIVVISHDVDPIEVSAKKIHLTSLNSCSLFLY